MGVTDCEAAMRPRNDTSQEIWRKTGTAGRGHPALQKEYGLRDQRAHWLRNDTSQEMRYKSGGRTKASAPTHRLPIECRGGGVPYGWVQGVR